MRLFDLRSHRLTTGLTLLGVMVLSTCSVNQVGLGAKVDITPPKISFTSPATGGQYFRGTFPVSGTTSDDLANNVSVTLTYQTQSGATAAQTVSATQATQSGGTKWTFNVPSGTGEATDIREGSSTVTALAKDDSGKTSSVDINVIVDNKKPTILVTVPSSYGVPLYATSNYLEIKGEVYDPSPVTKVEVTLFGSDGTTPVLANADGTVKWKTANGTNSWNTRIIYGATGDLDLTGKEGQTLRYAIRATDAAGNVSLSNYHVQDFSSYLTGGALFPSTDAIGQYDQNQTPLTIGSATATVTPLDGSSAKPFGDFLFDPSTNKPQVSFTNLAPTPATYDQNVLGFNASIRGRIDRGSSNGAPAVDPATITVTVAPISDKTKTKLMTPTVQYSNGSYTFQADVKDDAGVFYPNGYYQATIHAETTTRLEKTDQTVVFMINTKAPWVVTDSSLAPNAGYTGPYLNPISGFKLRHQDASTLAELPSFTVDVPVWDQNGSDKVLATTAKAYIIDSTGTKTEITAANSVGGASLVVTPPSLGSNIWKVQVPFPSDASLLVTTSQIEVDLVLSNDAKLNGYLTVTYNIRNGDPVVSGLTPASGSWVTGTFLTFNGAASVANTQQVRTTLVKAGTYADADAAKAAASNWPAAANVVSWSATHDMSGRAEETYDFWAVGRDSDGTFGTPVTIQVKYDNAAPEFVENTSLIAGSSLVVKNTDVTFGGDVSDVNLSSVSVSYQKDGAAPVVTPLTPVGNTWSWLLSKTLGDGIYDITFTAADASGKTKTFNRKVQIDTTSPFLAVTAPVSAELVSTGSYTIRGQVTDNGGKGITVLEYSKNSTDGTDGTWTAIPLSGLNWSVAGVDFSTGGEGTKKFSVRASDGLNPVSLSTVTFNYDTAPPVVSESAIGNSAQIIKNSAYTLSVSASDTNAMAKVEVFATKDGVTQSPTPYFSTSSLYTNWVLTPSLEDGLWVFTITATDVAGRTTSLTRTVLVDTTLPTTTIDPFGSTYYESSLPAAGTATDGTGNVSGLALIEYSISDGTTTTPWAAANGTDSWNKTVSIGALSPVGTWVLSVRATDKAGNVSLPVTTRGFTIDRANPTISETDYTGTAYKNAQFVVSLNLGDDLGLATTALTSALKVNNVTQTLQDPVRSTSGATAQNWTQTVPITYGDGTYTLSFTVQDGVNRTTTITRTVIIDTTAPSLAISSLNNGDLISSASLAVLGSSSDAGSGVKKVQYNLNSAGWVDAVGASSWTAALTGLTDSLSHSLLFRVEDNSGNVSASMSRSFQVDLANPALTETTSAIANSSLVYKNTAVTLGGAVSDANGITSLVVSYQKDGGTAIPTTVTPSSGTWTHTLPAAEGTYQVTVTATDGANKTTAITRQIMVDSTPPSLTVSAPAATELVATSAYTIRGQVTDNGGKGVSSLQYSQNSTDGTDGDWNTISFAGLNWSLANVDFSAGGEGAKTLWVKASDGLNPDTSTSIGFNYDTAAPTLSETTVGATQITTKTNFTLSGASQDSNALTSVGITATLNGTSQGSVFSATYPANTKTSQAWTYTKTVDTATHADDGLWVYTITATDAANRTTVLTRSVLVDTTAPTPTIDAFSADYYDSSLPASGTATDGTGNVSDLASVEYLLPGGTWTAVNGLATWNKTLSVSAQSEGSRTLSVRATDKAGNTSSPTTAIFTVDHANPVLTESSYVGTVYKKAAFSFTVNVQDTLGLPSTALTLDVTLPDSSVIQPNLAKTIISALNHSYDFTVPVTNGDGTYTVTLNAVDGVGRSATTLTRTVIVDTAAPNLVIGNLNDGDLFSSSSVTVLGTASDAGSGVAQVQYQTTTDGSTWSSWTNATGTSNWTAVLSGLTNSLTHSIRFQAIDNSGNVTATPVSRGFQVDLANPALTETTSAIANSSLVYKNSAVTLGGAVSDANGITSLVVSYQKDGGTAVPTTVTPSSGTWTHTLPAAEGTYQVTVTATDGANKTTAITRQILVDSTPPSLTISAPAATELVATSAYTIRGQVTDNGGKGVSSLQYSQNSTDGTDGDWNTISFAGLNWSLTNVNFSAGGEGAKTLWVKASDGLNPDTSTSIGFNYDTAAPTLTETGLNTTSQVTTKTNFTLSGASQDSNALTSVGITATLNGVSKPSPFSATYPDNTKTSQAWSFTKTVDTTATHADDGLWVYTITATDAANRTTVLTRTVLVDTTDPIPTIDTLSADYYDSTLPVSGTATDGTGNVSDLASVEYLLPGGTWTAVNGLATWNKTLSVSAQSEGSRTLSVRATDKAGNTSSPTTAIFTVDHANPVLTESSYVGTVYKKAAFSFTVDVQDTLGLGSTALTLDVTLPDASVIQPALTTNTISALHHTYDFTVPITNGDGTYTVTLNAVDGVGRSATTLTRTVIVDTAAPNLAITNLTDDDLFSSSSVTVLGTSSDSGSGVAQVQYQTSTDGSTWSSWTNATGTSNWTAVLSGLGNSLTHSVRFQAIDNSGNATATPVSRDFKVDLANPALTETFLATSSLTTLTATPTFTGAVSDANGITGLVVSYQKDGGTAVPTTVTPSAGTWTFALPSADGTYDVTITATDGASKTTSLTRRVLIDTTLPVVSITAPTASQWLSGASFTFRGTADDASGSGVNKVYYKVNTGSDISAEFAAGAFPATLNGWTAATGTVTWQDLWTLSGQGNRTLWVGAIDKAGLKSSVESVGFGIDQSAPSISEASAASQTKNAGFNLAGTFSDSNALAASASLTLSVDNGTATDVTALAPPYTFSTPGGAPNWQIAVAVDTAGHTDDGTHTYTLVATDVAGKTASITRTVTIDTRAPTITISAPTANAWVGTGAYPISGTASDGTGTGVSQVYYKAANFGTDLSAEDYTTWTLATSTANWTGSVTPGTEGKKTLWVKAVDSVGNVTATATTVTFGADSANPSLTETTIGTTTLTATKDDLILTGTYSDSNPDGNPQLSLEIDGNPIASPAFTAGAGTWSLTVAAPTDHSKDGTYSYAVIATDAAGKSTKVIRNIVVDTLASTVSAISTPAVSAWINGANYTIQGTADDTGSGVKDVFFLADVSVNDHASDDFKATWTKATGTTAWSGSLNLTTLGEGNKKLWIKVVDKAGNEMATASTVLFGVDQSVPTLTESAIAGGSSSSASYTGSANTLFNLSGNIGDTNGLSSLTVTESTDGGATNSPVTLVTPVSVSGTGQSWSTGSLPLGGANSGSYLYTITVSDIAGKTTQFTRTVNIDKTAPDVLSISNPIASSLLQGTIFQIKGDADDTAGGSTGVAKIYYRVTAQTTTEPTGVAGYTSFTATSGQWTANIDLSTLGEGSKTLWVRAEDAAGNRTADGSAASRDFFIDQTAPTLTETGVNTGALTTRTAAFDFTGAISDTNGLAATSPLTVSLDGAPATDIVPSGGTWTYNVNSGIGEGQHTYVFTATDAAGRTTQVTRTVILDTTVPTVTITTPTTSQWLSGASFTFRGTADDGSGSGVNKVYYKVNTGADISAEFAAGAFPATLNGWTAATGTVTWQDLWTLSGEGSRTLWVGAIDKAGLKSSVESVGFGIDQTAPSISEASAASQTKNANFSFSGTLSDSNALAASASLQVSIDNGGLVDVSTLPNGTYPQYTGTVGAGTWSLALNTASQALDGNHTLVFTATDVAGKTTSVTRSVLIDTVAASVSVSNPVAALMTNSTNLSLAGSSNDGTGSGVSQVWYKINTGTDVSAETPTVPNGWTQATGTTNWTASVTGLTAGAKKLWVKTVDNAGNVTSAANALAGVVNFTVDLTAPTLAETTIGATPVYRNAGYTFGGAGAASTATDALSGINTLTVTDNGGAPQAITVTTGNWSYVVSTLPADGTHTYVFTLSDLAGNQTTMTRTVIVDTAAASATVSSPVANLTTNATSLSLVGSANDGAGSGVSQVWYKVNTGADVSAEAPTVPNGWTLATGTSNWTGSATGLTEGTKKLWVKTVDATGNVTSAANALSSVVNFTVDLTAPVITEANIGAATVNRNVAFTFGGAGALSSATDALSGINTLVVSDNGGTPVSITVTAGKWSHVVSTLPADGTRTYLFTLTDLAGNQTTMTRTVVVDTAAATATVSSPVASLNTNSTSLTLAGSANDGTGSGVSQVWYKINTGTDVSAETPTVPNGWTQATGTTTWSATASGLTEGTKKLWTKTIDVAGNVTNAATALTNAVNFTVDLTAPVLTETNIGAATVNRNVAFTFGGAGALSSATDALSGINTLTVTDNGASAQTITVTAGKWSHVVSTLPADGTRTYLFTLTDLAGNQTTMTRTVVVDTAAASATVASPTASAQFRTSSVSLAGSANDGAGSGVSQVWYKINTGADISAEAPTVPNGWTQATGTTTWSATASGLTEGNKKLWTKTIDVAGNVMNAATALTNAVNFTVDLTAPVITETNIGAATVNRNVAYTFGGAGALSSATDALSGINTLTVTDNGGSAQTITVTAGKWSHVVSTLPADGTHTYLFTLTDLAGNQTTMTRTVIVDTAAAAATVSTPVASANTNSSSLSVAGSANDGAGSGVSQVWYKINTGTDVSAEAPTVPNGWTQATGTTTWSATASGLTEGTKKLWTKTIDVAGNVTNAATALANAVNFTVDLTAPVITETNIGAATVNRNVAYTFGGAGALSSATDALSGINTLTVTDNGGSAQTITVTAGKWSHVVSTLPADGTHTYLFTLTDLAGNQTTMTRTVVVDTAAAAVTVASPSALLNTNSSTLAVAGSANDGAGSGVSQVWYKINTGADVSAEAPTVPNGWTQATGTTTWSATASGLTEGTKKLWTKTIDVAGNVTNAAAALANAVNFTVDLTAPVITETNIGAATVNRNVAFTFGGAGALSSATDALSGINTLKVTDNGGAAQTITVTAGKWSHVVSTLPADGTHTYLFTLTDLAGNQTTMTRTVIVDTAAAVATVIAPAAASYSLSTVSLSGSANDGAGTGVSQVWYKINAGTDVSAETPTVPNGWTQATGTTNWTGSVSGLTEGTKKLWVKTLDLAGNVTNAATALASVVNFTTDLNPPTFSETGIGSTTSVSANFTLSGTAGDTIGLAASNAVQVSVDGAAAVDVTGTTTWSFPVTVNAVTHANDGIHTYTFTTTDASGKFTTLTRTVLVDTYAPAITYNNISGAGGSVFQDSTGKVTGTLSSASGLASGATALLEQLNYSTLAWSTVTGFNNVSLGISGSPKNYNWTVDLGAANLPDGKYRLSFVVPNVTTPALTLNTTSTPVTFLWSRSSPSLTVAAPALGTFQNADFAIAGTTYDYNAVTSLVAKISSGTVDFGSGTTPALPALKVGVTLGSPGVFTTAVNHGLAINDPVYLYGTPMPTANVALQTGTVYYVNSAPTGTTFTLKTLVSGGTVINLTSSTATNLLIASATKFNFIPTTQSVTVSANNANLTTSPLPSVGQAVNFQGGPLPTGLSGSATYYVISVGASDFQVSTTTNGSAVTPTTAGTISMTMPASWLVPAMSTSLLTDGSQTIYLQSTSANSAKSTTTSRDFTLDKTAPTIALTSPANGTRSVGNLTLIGTTTDSGSIPSGVTGTIQYQIGKNYNLSTGWTNTNVTGGAYSWSISLGDMSSYANVTYATESDTNGNAASGTNLWKLPIVFQATDNAGNIQQKTDYYLILDPNGNIPVMNITQPSNNLTFGGQQRITGTASQPTWVHDVEVSVDPTNTGSFAATVGASTLTYSTDTFASTAHGLVNTQVVYVKNGTRTGIASVAVNPKTPYYVINASANSYQLSATLNGAAVNFANILDSNTTESLNVDSWYPATLVTTGNSVIWYYDINVGNIYPSSGTSQTVQVQVRAWNSPSAGGANRGTIQGGLPTPLTMTFNSTFPKIGSLQINSQSYYSQITTRGTAISLTGQVSSAKGIAKVEMVESSPLSGSTTAYDSTSLTQNSFKSTNASKVVAATTHWTSTVAPTTVLTNYTFPAASNYKVLITNPGSNTALWVGAATTTAGSVYQPASSTTLNVTATGGEFLLSNSAGDFVYDVTMSIDSTKLYTNTTGQYSFDLRATDMGSPSQVSSSNILLNEDNYYPTSSLTSPNVLNATSMKIGNRYMIASTGGGTTDFTLYGAQSNTVGLTFLASGTPGSGTGTVYQVITNMYQNTTNSPLDANTGTFLTGTVFKIQGNATDSGSGSGTIGGLSKVVVYLRNPSSGNLLDMKTNAAAQPAGTTTALDVTGTGTVTSVPYPASDAYTPPVVGPAYFASIDSQAETGLSDVPGGSTNGNGDGFVEYFNTNGSTRDWWVQIDTTNLPDGPVEVHYVVWDAAGNASHYKLDSFVSNNAPVLASIDMGTDLDGSGTVTAGEITNYPASTNFATTGFSVRNNRLYFKMNTTRGTNTPLYYSVKYNGTELSTYSATTASLYSGSSYTIVAAGTVNWTGIGASASTPGTTFTYNGNAVTGTGGTVTGSVVLVSDFSSIPDSANAAAADRTFTIFVYDSTVGTTPGTNSQSFTQTVAMNIQNKDSSPPTIAVAPFGTLYTSAASDTSKALTTATYAQNIGASGGHLEYGAVNLYRSVTAVNATTMTSGQPYMVWSLGSTDFTTLGVTASPVSTLTPGLWYMVHSVGSTNFTTVGAATASPAIGTTFQATAVGTGSGLVIPVGTTFVYNGTSVSGTGTVKAMANIPALSGQVIFRGKAYDNQRISRLTATIPGFNGGAGVNNEFDIATWSGSGLVAAANNGNWSWALDTSDSVSQANGHVLNWTLTWDSSKLSTVAASGVAIVFKSYDFRTSATGATRGTTTTLTSTNLNGLALPNGTPIWVGTTIGTWSSGTWTTTVGAQSGNTVTLAAAIGTGNTSYVVSNTAGTSNQTVDVVPYVNLVTTRLASAYSSKPSVLQRSALGYYPVAEGETGVVLAGYNLNGASTVLSMNGYSTITPTGAAGASATFTVPSVATTTLTGPLVATVNAIVSGNNINDNTMPWNSAANGVNNNKLNDDLKFYVWKTTSILADGGVRYPNFRVGLDANQTFAFIFDSGAQFVKMATSNAVPAAVTPFQIDQSYTQWYDTALAVDSAGNVYGSSQNGDSGGGGSQTNGGYANNEFYAFNTAAVPGSNNTGNTGAYNAGTRKVAVENAFNGTTFDSNRVQNPKIATGTGGNTYYAYYSRSDNQLRFRWGNVSTPPAATTVSGITVANPGVFTTSAAHGLTVGRQVNFTTTGTYPTMNGVAMAATTVYYVATVPSATTFTLTTTLGSTTGMQVTNAGTATRTITATPFGGLGGALVSHNNTNNGSGANYQVIAGTGSTGTSTALGTTNVSNVGPYVAVGVTSTGTAVVAWYDSANQRLLYSYNTAPTSTANVANWGTNTIAIDTNFAGWYVDLVVDAADHVHIAYYSSSSGDLKYAYLPTANSTAPVVSTVDTFLSVGTNVGLTTFFDGTNYVPYITYYMGAYTQTNYSVRVSWRNDFTSLTAPANGAVNDAFTGNWESMTLPVSSIPLDYRIGVGIKKNSVTVPVDVPLLGYGTTAGLETAQLK